MMLNRYEPIVGKEKIRIIKQKIRRIKDKHIVFINSTYQGGGVAEMLNSMIPLFNDSGLKVGWRVLHGSNDFFNITKQFHNALQGEKITLTKRKKEIYEHVNKDFALYSHFDHDLVVVHDPQPMALVEYYKHKFGRNKQKQPWLFRLHIDSSKPYKPVWDYLSTYLHRYDGVIVSKEEYMNDALDVPHHVFYPAIDPLTLKNKQLTKSRIKTILAKQKIPIDKPIISQISRFDKWKDPLGVIDLFETTRCKKDCRLVLLGSAATDDPEGILIYNEVLKKVASSKYKKDIHVLLVNSEILVNALQRASSVIIQNSRKEGFGLTVSEALFKGTPVVSTNVGGIPVQVQNGISGFLHEHDDVTGMARSIIQLIEDDRLRKEMGLHGKRFITQNFLITRLIEDYLDLFYEMLS
jgi:trehalose synthase